jgi:hypothetical protein
MEQTAEGICEYEIAASLNPSQGGTLLGTAHAHAEVKK